MGPVCSGVPTTAAGLAGRSGPMAWELVSPYKLGAGMPAMVSAPRRTFSDWDLGRRRISRPRHQR